MPLSARPRVLPAVGLVGAVILAGATLLWWLGDGRFAFKDALYFAIICASTVGFGEPPEVATIPGGRIVTSAIILTGLAVVAYFQSSLTTFLLQDIIGHKLRARRMQKRIDNLSGHIVVAGAGSVGRHVIDELVLAETPFVVIDQNRELLEEIASDHQGNVLYVVGDATHDHALAAAGLERASGVIAALTEDKDNLYVTLTARELNPKARIVTKVVQPEAAKKMRRAGADGTVAPARIGGLRMASEMLRPTTVNFLDRMLRGHKLRFDEVEVMDTSWVVGRRLRELPIRQTVSVLIVAIYEGDAVKVTPDADTIIDAGMTLVVVGELPNIERLRRLISLESPPSEEDLDGARQSRADSSA